MSYIRPGHPMIYVEGDSTDYVFSDGKDMEDYGSLSKDGLVEILCRLIDRDTSLDTYEKQYFWNQLAEKLGVKLRDKPLTDKEFYTKSMENLEAFKKSELGKVLFSYPGDGNDGAE